MKIVKYLSAAIILTAAVAGTGCKKETTEGTSREVKVSYPEITLNGNAVVTLAVGAAYTDAGAKLKDDVSGNVTEIQPSSTNVNTAAPGLYIVNFLAANENGFEATASRRVAVSSVTGSPDRSGTYNRAATGQNVKVEKVSNGVYKVTNPGGAANANDVIVYFVETAANVFTAPPQPTTVGTMSVINIAFTATGATWNVINPGYGTGQRILVKQ